jgi:peptide/nickel transport system ATP-binding protein
MTSADDVLRVEGLSIELARRDGSVGSIVEDVALRIGRREIVGLIGESGSGKTMTAKSLVGMLPPRIKVAAGRAIFEGRDLLALEEREIREIRGARSAVIPQDALHALNPVQRIGRQVGEPIRVHSDADDRTIRARVLELLAKVRIDNPAARAGDYPHQFSGGMQQRALTAMALAMEAPLIIADEPTTALDVTIQAQIIELIRELRDETRASFLFVSHDLGLVASLCERIYVMYAGHIVESGPRDAIFTRPEHPYTRDLIGSIPRLNDNPERLRTIAGQIPSPFEHDAGCRFRNRCPLAEARCGAAPPLRRHDDGHESRCWIGV